MSGTPCAYVGRVFPSVSITIPTLWTRRSHLIQRQPPTLKEPPGQSTRSGS